MIKNCQAIHKRLARFTAKRKSITSGGNRCARQISVYTIKTEKIEACRCIRKKNHKSPHRFRHADRTMSELKFKKGD